MGSISGKRIDEIDTRIGELLIKDALTYNYKVKDLVCKYGYGKETIRKILIKRGYNFEYSRYRLRLKKIGIVYEDVKAAADYYLDNKCTIKDIFDKFKISKTLLLTCLGWCEATPTPHERKTRQSAWNKGKTKKTDKRLIPIAKFLSNKKQKTDSIRTWSDEFNRPILIHHYVWFQNTGYLPDTKSGEQIHHIDGNHQNNDFSNLYLTNVKTHTEMHKEYERVCFALIKEKLIFFDKETGGINWNSVETIIKKLKG